MAKKKTSFRIIALVFIVIILFSSCLSAKSQEKIKVSWIDADGSLIQITYLDEIDNFQERELPSDTEKWHYTDWKIVYSTDLVICVAQRVERIKYIWKNIDGSIIQEKIGVYSEKLTHPEMYDSKEQWKYTGWNKSFIENTCIFTPQRIPNEEYFSGNVFQIVLNDESGTPISTGSGFIFNEEGWFITNNHVMDGGFSASAYFDIPNIETGEDYSKLSVIGGVYNNKELDIFIGKLENYAKLKDNYRNIIFNEKYEIGETTYSIGYPNSSLFMQINQGTLLEEYKDIYSKIYNTYYLLSDSYIAPGSSGGILVNENFEVIGITTLGLYADKSQTVYIAGGAVPTNLFYNRTKNPNELDLKLLNEIYL